MPSSVIETLPEERLPAAHAVVAEFTLTPKTGAAILTATPAAAEAGKYRVLRTAEVDEYDSPVPLAQIGALVALRAAPAENDFTGTARAAAKLSIADAPIETFADVKDLIDTLPKHDAMKNHPDISVDEDNDRVPEERRNAKVTAFLYAASMEGDNDFHLIIGRDPSKSEKYMTAEISGLPPNDAASFATLKSARDSYLQFFADGLPGTSYDFYDPPIPIEVTGSLFFDFSHAKGSRPGPQTLRPRMPVVWEIHPITKIVFEP